MYLCLILQLFLFLLRYLWLMRHEHKRRQHLGMSEQNWQKHKQNNKDLPASAYVCGQRLGTCKYKTVSRKNKHTPIIHSSKVHWGMEKITSVLFTFSWHTPTLLQIVKKGGKVLSLQSICLRSNPESDPPHGIMDQTWILPVKTKAVDSGLLKS